MSFSACSKEDPTPADMPAVTVAATPSAADPTDAWETVQVGGVPSRHSRFYRFTVNLDGHSVTLESGREAGFWEEPNQGAELTPAGLAFSRRTLKPGYGMLLKGETPRDRVSWSIKVDHVVVGGVRRMGKGPGGDRSYEILRAVDWNTEEVLWERPLERASCRGFQLDHERVAFMTDEHLNAVSIMTGREVWPPIPRRGMTIWTGRVRRGELYVKSTKNLYKVDDRTGRMLWEVPAEGRAECTLLEDCIVDPSIIITTGSSFEKRVRVKLEFRDPASGRVTQQILLREFQGGFDDFSFVSRYRPDRTLAVGVRFLTHD